MTELEPRKDGQLVDQDDIDDEDDRSYQAARLQLQGLDWEIIAAQCGFANAKSAEVAVRIYNQRTAVAMDQQRREEILHISRARIERLLAAQWSAAEAGDTKAAEFCLRAAMSIAKLYGVDELHTKTAGTSKTIVIAGNSEQYAQALKQIAEE